MKLHAARSAEVVRRMRELSAKLRNASTGSLPRLQCALVAQELVELSVWLDEVIPGGPVEPPGDVRTKMRDAVRNMEAATIAARITKAGRS